MNWPAADQTVNAVWESSCFSRQTILDAQICSLFGICSLSQRLVIALGNFGPSQDGENLPGEEGWALPPRECNHG